MKYHFKTKPFAHQVQATKRAVKLGSMAFFMEPGTGKTKAALDAIAIQALRGKCERVAVLAPLTVIDVWPGQIEQHFPFPAILEDSDYIWWANEPEFKGAYVADWEGRLRIKTPKFFLLNYEKISRRERRGKRWVYPYVKQLEDFRPDVLVLDESHRCKRASANRSQALYRLTARLRDSNLDFDRLMVYLLSGTPNPKGYIDLFSQYRIMDPELFGTSKQYFEDCYCQYGFGKNQYKVVRYRGKKQLLRKVRSRAFIRTKAECLDLPPVMPPSITPVYLPPSAQKQYLSMVNDFVAWIADPTDDEGNSVTITAKNAGARRTRLQQITGGFTTDGTQIHTAKVDAARELLTDLFEQDEAVVIYARFLPEVAALDAVVKKLGVPIRTITGAVKDRHARYIAWHDFFQQGQGARAILFQVQTGSEGIDLFASANILFYSLPQGWETLFQCVSRLERIGQTRAISQHYLLCPGTLDPRQFQALKDHRDMHAELMGNPEGFLLGE